MLLMMKREERFCSFHYYCYHARKSYLPYLTLFFLASAFVVGDKGAAAADETKGGSR